MTAATLTDRARKWSRLLEDKEAARTGQPIKIARQSIARRAGVSPGTLENLRKNRLKEVGAYLYGQLFGLVERELLAEIKHLETELEILRRDAPYSRGGEVAEVLESLEKARAALGLPPIGGA